MRAPLVAYVAIAAQAVPLFAAAAVRHHIRGARTWVLLWCGFLFATDVAGGWLGSHGVQNLLLINGVAPASVTLVLWTASLWQSTDIARLTMRLAIVPFLLLWMVLSLAFDDSATFSAAAVPMANLVGLGAAAFTLVARSARATDSLLRHDWFWVSAGTALYFGGSAALSPLSALLVGSDPGLLDLAYQGKSALDIAAFLAIARGVTCQPET